MAGLRLPLFRTQVSGNFDGGESSQIYQLKYDPDHSLVFRPANTQDDETGVTGKPLFIYEYEFTCMTDVPAAMFQYYGDDDDEADMSNWDPSNKNFQLGLKQHKLIPGARVAYVDTTLIPDTVKYNSLHQQRTIRFKAWGRGKGRKFEWVVPPIKLSRASGNYIGWSVANLTGNDGRNYIMDLMVKKWKQFT